MTRGVDFFAMDSPPTAYFVLKCATAQRQSGLEQKKLNLEPGGGDGSVRRGPAVAAGAAICAGSGLDMDGMHTLKQEKLAPLRTRKKGIHSAEELQHTQYDRNFQRMFVYTLPLRFRIFVLLFSKPYYFF